MNAIPKRFPSFTTNFLFQRLKLFNSLVFAVALNLPFTSFQHLNKSQRRVLHHCNFRIPPKPEVLWIYRLFIQTSNPHLKKF